MAQEQTNTATEETKAPKKAKKAKAEKPAAESKKGDGEKQAYALEGSDRVELLTEKQAGARNAARNDGKKWVPAPDKAAQAKEPKDPPKGEERVKLTREGKAKDAAADKAAREKKASEKSEDAAEGEEKPAKKVKKASDAGRARAEWEGHGMCDLLRYCGAQGWDKPTARKVLEGLGLTPGNSTVHIQVGKGKNNENVPSLSKEHAAKLKGLAKEAKTGEKA